MQIIISRLVLVVAALGFLAACSGNKSSSSTEVPERLKLITGIVHDGYAQYFAIQGVGVANNGQLDVDAETGGLDGVSTTTDQKGRFSVAVDANEPVPVVVFARGNVGVENKKDSQIQCQLPAGCSVAGQTIEFGGYYSSAAFFDYQEADGEPEAFDTTLWSAVIPFTADGQFVSINPITDMAGAYGFATYINDGTGQCDQAECTANERVSGFFSKYGIIKSNSQMANLLGIADIISTEPANIPKLDKIQANNSSSLLASIKYGALIAALQSIQLQYEAGKEKTDRRFRRVLNEEFAAQRGQLYQKLAGGSAVLTMETWLSEAKSILEQATSYFNGKGIQLPVEVGSVVSDFNLQLMSLQEGVLTNSQPTIDAEVAQDYEQAVEYSKAMVNYLQTAVQEFGSSEFQTEWTAYQQQLDQIGSDLTPAFNAVSTELLQLYGYYLSCVYDGCDNANSWHVYNAGYDASNKTLQLKYSEQAGDGLVVFQRIVDLDLSDAEDNPTESYAIDFVIEGVLKSGDLEIDTNFAATESEDGQSPGTAASMRVSYGTQYSQLQPDEPLASLNPSMPVNNRESPLLYEFNFPTIELKYRPANEENQQTLIGSFSWLLRGVVNVRDTDGPVRYNLNNLSAAMSLEGKALGTVPGSDTVISDNVSISIVASGYNSSNFYPDTVFPESTNFFVPRVGLEKGTSSNGAIVTTSIVDYVFPQVDDKGQTLSGAIEEGKVVADKAVTVKILRMDYQYAGSAALIAYPSRDDGKYLGLLCAVTEEDEVYFDAGEVTKPAENTGDDPEAVFSCFTQDFFDGPSGVNNLANEIWSLDKNSLRAVNVQGEGVYYANFPENGDGSLVDFPQAEADFDGVMQFPAMLGIDNIRLQIRPELANADGSVELPVAALDLNLIKPTISSVNVGLFVAFDPEQILNSEDGLPILASGDEVESFYLSFKTDSQGNELGEFIFNWQGAQFVDDGSGGKKLQDYDANNSAESESLLFNVSSDVFYSEPDDETTPDELRKCGYLFSGKSSEQACNAIAYLTFRGLVTGTVREERPGVYVARYIDGSWQIIGG